MGRPDLKVSSRTWRKIRTPNCPLPDLKLPGSGPQTAHLIEKRKCTGNSSRWTPNCPALAQKAAWQRAGKGQRPATYCLRTPN
jgi:hypothetical protein